MRRDEKSGLKNEEREGREILFLHLRSYLSTCSLEGFLGSYVLLFFSGCCAAATFAGLTSVPLFTY